MSLLFQMGFQSFLYLAVPAAKAIYYTVLNTYFQRFDLISHFGGNSRYGRLLINSYSCFLLLLESTVVVVLLVG